MRQSISLNDSDWFVGAVSPQTFPAPNDFARVEGWIPAAVPGDVRLDLLRIGKIPDPFLGKNNEASQWIDEYDWWYRREVNLDAKNNVRTFLVFDGIDYQSQIFWNDVELGKHVGMFSRQVYEIPCELVFETNRLAVRVSGGNQLPRVKLNLRQRAWQSLASRVIPHAPQAHEFPERYATLKCQMSFGWDFAPRLLTCGIWDDAVIVQTREILLRDAWVQGVPDGRVRVVLDADVVQARDLRVRFEVRGKNFDAPTEHFEISFRFTAGENHSFAFQLKNPRVWNPWDRGEPNLYVLRVSITDEHGEMDSIETSFGLRTIELTRNLRAPAESAPWTFQVNGQPEFIRGANWVPADAIPARVTHEDYAAYLQMARAANINLLRVWGGGLKEKRSFYELCDNLGILVWQEFPFAGAGIDYFPHDQEFLDLARQECQAIVRALRNHPSVVLWCGGNEFIPRLNRHVIEMLRQVVAKYDGTRPFKPGSPSQDESHNWRVWHGGANTRAYQEDPALFFGEFGLQALPGVETLARFLPDDQLSPLLRDHFPPLTDAEAVPVQPGDWWEYHNAEREKLWRYAAPILQALGTAEISLEQFVSASQQAQLRGLQIAIENARRNKPRVSGCVFWQFNEPWYSICWSVLDYTRTPKRAYLKIQELYNPTLVSFDYPYRQRGAGEIVSGEIWIINDTLRDGDGVLRAWHNDAHILELDMAIPSNDARALAHLDVMLQAGTNLLRFEWRGSDFVSTNEYDLNYWDEGEIKPRHAFLSSVAAWLRTSM